LDGENAYGLWLDPDTFKSDGGLIIHAKETELD
jgi:hypothetical protein